MKTDKNCDTYVSNVHALVFSVSQCMYTDLYKVFHDAGTSTFTEFFHMHGHVNVPVLFHSAYVPILSASQPIHRSS